MVLHDGAPNGERKAWGRVFSVFDEIERWQPSRIPTLEVEVTAAGDADAEALTELFDQAGFAAQDWTTSIRWICKECSEGQPPDSHEHLPPPTTTDRRFGLAAPPDEGARSLAQWAAASPDSRGHGTPAVVG